MMQVISVVGATATGKTAFALKLAATLLDAKKHEKIHLLSADSRQVYQGLENLTGADLPTDFQVRSDREFSYPFFSNKANNIFIHGVSIIETNEEWSVAHFKKLFENIRLNFQDTDCLIVVGGTGLYQQQLLHQAETVAIPQDKELRQRLEQFDLNQLKDELQKINHKKYLQMNNSDINNSRRLIRAIEVTLFEKHQPKKQIEFKQNCKITKIEPQIYYLQLSEKERQQKIKERVKQRFDLAKAEVAKQLATKQNFNLPAFSSTGFQELRKFLSGEIDYQTCLQLWQTAEIQYAKRQDTWWKKNH